MENKSNMLFDANLSYHCVFDMTDMIADISYLSGYPRDSKIIENWIADFLDLYLYVDSACLKDENSQNNPDLLNESCGVYLNGVTKKLYKVLYPIMYIALHAAFTSVTIDHGILTIKIFDFV